MSRTLNLKTLSCLAPLCLGLGILSAGLFAPPPPPKVLEKSPFPPITSSSLPKSSRHFQNLQLTNLQTGEDCQEEIARLHNSPDLHPMIRSALHDRALRAWLKIDSAGALTFTESSGGKFTSFHSEGIRLFRVWFDLDPESALEAQKITSPALSKIVHPSLLKSLAQVDPHRALSLLNEVKIDRQRKWQWSSVESEAYRRWGQDQPEEALQHMLNNSKLISRGFLNASTLLGDWSSRDPEAAWKFFQAHKAHRHLRRHASSLLAINLLKSDPTRLKDIDTKSADSLAQKWAQSDLQGAIDFADTLNKDDPWYYHFASSIAGKLAVSEPEKAIEMTLAAHNGPEAFASIFGAQYGSPHNVFFSAFSSLHSTQPERSLDLLKSIPENYQTQALTGILRHEFSKGPEQALQSALKLQEDPRIPIPLHDAIATLFGSSTTIPQIELTPFIDHFPQLRESLVQNPFLLKTWVQHSPEAAASFIKEEALNGQSPEPKTFGLPLVELTTARPEFTSQWIHELPPGELQNNAAEILVANWNKYDPAATQEWIQNLPEGELRTKTLEAIKPE